VSGVGSAASTALSGVLAASTRLDVAANNIANAQDTGKLSASTQSPTSSALTGVQSSNVAGQVYHALQATPKSLSSGGVAVSVTRSSKSGVAFSPDDPNANSDGLVATPAIDEVTQITALTSATQDYKASAMMLKTANDMAKTLLNVFG